MLWQDLRHALRRLVQDRSLSVMAAAALGLGIGANATVFAIVHAAFIRGLPFDEPGRIISVSSRDGDSGQTGGVSLRDFDDYRAAAASFSGLAAFTAGGTANLSDAGRPPERVNGSLVTPNTFRLLGQPVLLGRDFRPE
ncbi:MAG: multidrug ABC transporter substrate-binding protein, partial [Acidobacteria bacterium]|nr:multidrug ABC transporter substrate-binding protein [Acidobacteriota bacterium]